MHYFCWLYALLTNSLEAHGETWTPNLFEAEGPLISLSGSTPQSLLEVDKKSGHKIEVYIIFTGYNVYELH